MAALPENSTGGDENRHEIQQTGGPMSGVSERKCEGRIDHDGACESSQSPRHVKPTITTSIHICDCTAARALPQTAMALSWATISPATWPASSANTCTHQ